MIHKLKTWPTYFETLLDGSKTFELRKDDRGFVEGDVLLLREYDPVTEKYTDREIRARVTCIIDNVEEWGLMDGFCIMSIRRITKRRTDPAGRDVTDLPGMWSDEDTIKWVDFKRIKP